MCPSLIVEHPSDYGCFAAATHSQQLSDRRPRDTHRRATGTAGGATVDAPT